MAEMPEQRPVVLAHLRAHLLALGGVRLGDVERDQSVVVTGQDMLAARSGTVRVGEEIEGQSHLVAGIRLRPDRQSERQQRIDRPLLGRLDAGPAFAVAGDRQVRDDLVEDAGRGRNAALPAPASCSRTDRHWRSRRRHPRPPARSLQSRDRRAPDCRKTGTAHSRNTGAGRNAGRKRASSQMSFGGSLGERIWVCACRAASQRRHPATVP